MAFMPNSGQKVFGIYAKFMISKFPTKFLFFLLGVISTLIVGASLIYATNPIERVKQKYDWLYKRVSGANDVLGQGEVKINDARFNNYKNWSMLTEEFNKSEPNWVKMNEYAANTRQGLAKISASVDETCNKYREFIFNDPLDVKQRGQDAEKICDILNGYKEATQHEEKALQAMLKDNADDYKKFTGESDAQIIATSKAIGNFVTSPLNPPNCTICLPIF